MNIMISHGDEYPGTWGFGLDFIGQMFQEILILGSGTEYDVAAMYKNGMFNGFQSCYDIVGDSIVHHYNIMIIITGPEHKFPVCKVQDILVIEMCIGYKEDIRYVFLLYVNDCRALQQTYRLVFCIGFHDCKVKQDFRYVETIPK